jgi:hypothetical protein
MTLAAAPRTMLSWPTIGQSSSRHRLRRTESPPHHAVVAAIKACAAGDVELRDSYDAQAGATSSPHRRSHTRTSEDRRVGKFSTHSSTASGRADCGRALRLAAPSSGTWGEARTSDKPGWPGSEPSRAKRELSRGRGRLAPPPGDRTGGTGTGARDRSDKSRRLLVAGYRGCCPSDTSCTQPPTRGRFALFDHRPT